MHRSALLAAVTTLVVLTTSASASTTSHTPSRDRYTRLRLVAYFHGPNASTATSGVVETNFHVKLVARFVGIQPHLESDEVLRIYGRKVKPAAPAKIVRGCASSTQCTATVFSQVEAHWMFQAAVVNVGRRPHTVLHSNVVQVVWYQKPPISLELTVNGKSARATTAKTSNHDPTPLVVHYGVPLNIAATADKPMPAGWTMHVYHPGDPLSPGNGVYYLVCKTTTAHCGATRPAPTNAASADFDDIVYADITKPDGGFRYVQIDVQYRK